MCRSFMPEILISADCHKPKTFKLSEDEYVSVFRWMEKKERSFSGWSLETAGSVAQVLMLFVSHLFPFYLKTEVVPSSVLLIFRRVRVVIRSVH